MSLNDIKLSPHLTANLYTSHLIKPEKTEFTKEVKINFLGKNEKRILIVVNNTECAFLPDNELNFLTSVLSACSLSLADVAIINHNKNTESYQLITDQLNTTSVLLFDLSPSDFGLPVNFPDFQVQKVDKIQYLAAPSLSLVELNKDLKKSLWNALKRMFGI